MKSVDPRPDLVAGDGEAFVRALADALALGIADAKMGAHRSSYDVARAVAARWLAAHRRALHAAYAVGRVRERAWEQAPGPGLLAVESGPSIADAPEVEPCAVERTLTVRGVAKSDILDTWRKAVRFLALLRIGDVEEVEEGVTVFVDDGG